MTLFDAGCPNIIFIKGHKYDTASKEWTTVGHNVVGIGYRVSKDEKLYFIQVCDGWNPTGERYVKYNTDTITLFKGAVVDVS